MAAIQDLKSTQTLGWRGFVCALLVASTAVCSFARAQAPAASGDGAVPQTPEQLEKLVGPIALYPDDLLAIILPACTFPLQLVQADRFLDKRKADPKLPVDANLDDSVKSLLNYPEVVKKMSSDLDWTVALGEAVAADQGSVMDAIQAFRRRTESAGNLKSDDKQTVVVEKEVVKIVPANPQVIYVPQYNPTTVVVQSSVPVWGYYPSPYPVYYYPYPPGAAFATGLIWGAAIGAAWNGGHWNTNWGGNNNNNITINRGGNTINTGNINTGNINRGGANASQRPAGGDTAWKSNKTPGQVAGSAGRAPSTGRVGDSQLGGGRGGDSQLGGGGRASAQPAGGGGRGGDSQLGGGARASTQPAGGGVRGSDSQFGGGAGASARDRSAAGGASGGRDAFGGYGSGSGRQTQMDSSRGAASRSSMASSGASRSSMASSGASRGASGGGARAGGGARGGGRR